MDKMYITTRLQKFGIAPAVTGNYEEPHRHYHNLQHIYETLTFLEDKGVLDNDILFLAAVFHDIVYNPKANDNEEQSAMFFEKHFNGDASIKQAVKQIILDTKNHKASGELSGIFQQADLAIFDKPFEQLLEYENMIFKEFGFVDWKIYQRERVKILQQFNTNGRLDALIAYVQSRRPNIGVYAGSFNPFHLGHYNILEKAEHIFDKVIIAFGQNPEKNEMQRKRPNTIQYYQIEEYSGLVTDLIRQLGYDVVLIRGLRNADDFNYEIKQYRYMQDLMQGIKTICLFCDKEYAHISSSGIRVLERYGKDKDYLLE